MPSYTAELRYGTPRSITETLQKGQWLTSLDMNDTYFHIGINPADMLPSYMSQRHSMGIHSSVIRFLNQPESTYKNTQASSHGTSLWLGLVINLDNYVGYKPSYVGCMPLSCDHVS